MRTSSMIKTEIERLEERLVELRSEHTQALLQESNYNLRVGSFIFYNSHPHPTWKIESINNGKLTLRAIAQNGVELPELLRKYNGRRYSSKLVIDIDNNYIDVKNTRRLNKRLENK